jgi:hypothetical protein
MILPSDRLKLKARVFLAGRPQLGRSVGHVGSGMRELEVSA